MIYQLARVAEKPTESQLLKLFSTLPRLMSCVRIALPTAKTNTGMLLQQEQNRGTRTKVYFWLFLISLTFSSTVAIRPVKAEEVCQVTDPTGTPLNVRSTPNGPVTDTLKNGREVYIHELSTDAQGRAWAKVGGYSEGKYRTWGWVIREFISCYSR
jgi:hypothetical protein